MKYKIKNGYCLIDRDDLETIRSHKWSAQDVHGIKYAFAKHNGKTTTMHAYLMGKNIDHKNGNGLDNRRCNLRKCNISQNNANRKKLRSDRATSKFKGVYFNGSSWVCVAWKNKKWYYGGSYKNEFEAAQKYNELAIKLHGEFARLNVI